MFKFFIVSTMLTLTSHLSLADSLGTNLNILASGLSVVHCVESEYDFSDSLRMLNVDITSKIITVKVGNNNDPRATVSLLPGDFTVSAPTIVGKRICVTLTKK